MALITTQAFPLGTKLFCKFVVFESDSKGSTDFYEVLIVFGEVRSIVSVEEGPCRMGICFEEMDSDQKTKIFDIVHSPLKYENWSQSLEKNN